MSNWVSMEDHNPAPDIDVWVIAEKAATVPPSRWVELAYQSESGTWWCYSGEEMLSTSQFRVTHWQPVIKPEIDLSLFPEG